MQALQSQIADMVTIPERRDAAAPPTRADEAMDRYAEGDETAFGALYDELAPRLYGYAFRSSRSQPAAEDVVQQTFLQIHLARAGFARGAAVLPWAYAIARRLIIDAGRRSGREELREQGALDLEAPSGLVGADEALALKQDELAPPDPSHEEEGTGT